jgi:hypothetical protein
LQTEGDLVGPVVVGQKDGHMVAGSQAVGMQGLCESARASLELAERDGVARRGDDGKTIRVRRRIRPGPQRRPPTVAADLLVVVHGPFF